MTSTSGVRCRLLRPDPLYDTWIAQDRLTCYWTWTSTYVKLYCVRVGVEHYRLPNLGAAIFRLSQSIYLQLLFFLSVLRRTNCNFFFNFSTLSTLLITTFIRNFLPIELRNRPVFALDIEWMHHSAFISSSTGCTIPWVKELRYLSVRTHLNEKPLYSTLI